ncbi:MAG: hypothetical protein LBK47_10710 [Prevotellaceae bacterium]|jgi:hypothetical protein|nr:hypothetical protein [Prevotellaceae bacterium]
MALDFKLKDVMHRITAKFFPAYLPEAKNRTTSVRRHRQVVWTPPEKRSRDKDGFYRYRAMILGSRRVSLSLDNYLKFSILVMNHQL